MKNTKLITIVGWTLIAIATVCNTVAGMLAYNRMFEEFYNRIAQKTEDERISVSITGNNGRRSIRRGHCS